MVGRGGTWEKGANSSAGEGQCRLPPCVGRRGVLALTGTGKGEPREAVCGLPGVRPEGQTVHRSRAFLAKSLNAFIHQVSYAN